MPTIYDLAHDLTPLGMDRVLTLHAYRGKTELPRVTDGIKTAKPPTVEGLHVLAPEQLLSLHIPVVSVNGRVDGYQRPLQPRHARNIARAMLEGKPMPPIIVALDGRGYGKIVEGQHRAVGAVMARMPLEAVVRRMDATQQRDLFAGQRRAKPVDPNTLILAGSGPYEKYIQAAVSTNAHAWGELVSSSPTSKTRMSPNQMMGLLLRYVGNAEAHSISPSLSERWDTGKADEMAPLVAAFGNKQSHPLAFSPVPLRAIGSAAMYVFRRSEPLPGDHERWVTHMPKFAFEHFTFVRTQQRMTDELLNHWNKRLSAERRVSR